MIDQPEYAEPHTRDHNVYAIQLKQFNRMLQERMKVVLNGIVPKNAEITIVTTGSDGRHEKGPVSKLEFIVLTDSEARETASEIITEVIHTVPKFARAEFEVKNIALDEMSYVNNNHNLAYPMRLLDSALLYGDPERFLRAKMNLFKEFEGKNGASILQRVKRKSMEYRDTAGTGIQKYNKDREIRHFNLEDGIVYYGRDGALSFKPGPLRYTQFELMRSLMVSYRAAHDGEKEGLARMFAELPTNTVDKLLTLECSGISALEGPEMNGLCDGYNFFLREYNECQEHHDRLGIEALPLRELDIVKEKMGALCNAIGKQLILAPKASYD